MTMRLIVVAALLGSGLCSIGLAAPAGSTQVTFNKDIAPILFANCATCHRPGEVAPFPLLTYRDAVKKAETIEKVVSRRLMPPWKVEPTAHAFLDERRLSDAHVAAISAWVRGGKVEGDPADLPPLPKFTEGWQLGPPDLVLEFPEDVTVPAEGRDVFRNIVIPSGVIKDKTVSAIEFRPGNRNVVHHALVFLDNSGKGRKKDAEDPEPGYRTFGGIGFTPSGALGGWAPGAMPRHLPDGVGRMMHKNSDLIVQMHYHPSGKIEKDRSSVGIYFTKSPADKILLGIPLGTRAIFIKPGEKAHKVTSQFILPTPVQVIGATPHMHWLGKTMKLEAQYPNGRRETLLSVSDWDFNWQDQYLYAKPVALPAGTKLLLEAVYDNSADNPRNPSSPPKLVTFGEQTENEMCFCFLNVVPDHKLGYLSLLKAMGEQLGGRRKKVTPAAP